MNFQQALLWMALTAVAGIFVFIIYTVIKEEREERKEKENDKKEKNGKKKKDEPDTNNQKPKARKRAAGAGCQVTNAGQEVTRTDTKISSVSNSKVKVINITNYHPASGHELRREQPSNRMSESTPTEAAGETQKASLQEKK